MYKHQALQDSIRRNLMLSPLLYKEGEIYVVRKDTNITVIMQSEEDRMRRSSAPERVTASLIEWQAMFEEFPRLAQHLAMVFSILN